MKTSYRMIPFKVALKTELPEQGTVNILTPLYAQQVYRQCCRPCYCPNIKIISLIFVNIHHVMYPSNSTPLVLITIESRDLFIKTSNQKPEISGMKFLIVDHFFTQLTLIDLFIPFQKIPR